MVYRRVSGCDHLALGLARGIDVRSVVAYFAPGTGDAERLSACPDGGSPLRHLLRNCHLPNARHWGDKAHHRLSPSTCDGDEARNRSGGRSAREWQLARLTEGPKSVGHLTPTPDSPEIRASPLSEGLEVEEVEGTSPLN